MKTKIEILREKLVSNGLENNQFVKNHNEGKYDLFLECMEEYIKTTNSFEEACEPLMKWLSDNHHPHTMAEVECNRAILWEGKQSYLTDAFILD